MYRNLPTLGLTVLVLLVLLRSAIFIVPEGEQVAVLRFGKLVGSSENNPVVLAGFYFKWPFVDEARYYQKRIMNWDGNPNLIPTKDKKYIYVDSTARWRIADLRTFILKVQQEERALARLDGFIASATKAVISRNNIVEAVRNSNSILKKPEKKRKKGAHPDEPAEEEAVLTEIIEEEIIGEIEPVTLGREKLSAEIVKTASSDVAELGIELIDVQLRSVTYEESVQDKAFDRMVSERRRIAEKIRSIGKGEEAKIRGLTSKELQEIESGAYRKVQEIKGKADAEAIGIYAGVIEQNPDFYEFSRTIEAYRKGLRDDTKLILSAEADFLKLLNNGLTTLR